MEGSSTCESCHQSVTGKCFARPVVHVPQRAGTDRGPGGGHLAELQTHAGRVQRRLCGSPTQASKGRANGHGGDENACVPTRRRGEGRGRTEVAAGSAAGVKQGRGSSMGIQGTRTVLPGKAWDA
jgi:hypothetical protein